MTKSYRILPVVFTLSTILSGCLSSESSEVLLPVVQGGSEITYDVTEVKKGYIAEIIEVQGEFIARERISLSFGPVGGYLKDVYAYNGEAIRKGQLLAELDSDILDFQWELEQLSLERAELVYEKESGFSSSEVDRELAGFNLAEQKLRAEQAEYHRSLAQLTAPFGGNIVYRNNLYEPGDYIPPYTMILQMSEPGNIEIIYNGSNADSFYSGMIVEYQLPRTNVAGRFDEVYKAEVVQTPRDTPPIEDVSFSGSVIFRPIGEAPPRGRGSWCYVTLVKNEKPDALLIPQDLVETRHDGSYVVVLNDENRPVVKLVEIGLEQSGMVEIIDGLEEGDMVLKR